ncbi:MAG: phosphoribosylaminoimidazolesuccinocarboxamide synthase [Elusimicrobiota bacterium]
MVNELVQSDLKTIKLLFRGKVRDVYDLEDKLLIVATDRISAFDYILPTPVTGKGKILTRMSVFWFHKLAGVVENHLIETDAAKYPEQLREYEEQLEGRSMLVKKARRINVECVVRGYLAGSAWKEYQKTGTVCGIALPSGMKESQKIENPIFTPALKSMSGHDINVSEQEVINNEGYEIAKFLKDTSLELYSTARDYADTKGLILADTKFEFGILEGKTAPILIDEVLTPDSSRYWEKDKYAVGQSQESFDKQFVRDYLESIKWDKQPPVPSLPEEIVKKTLEKYEEAYKRLIGK